MKCNENDNVVRYNAGLVARGYAQRSNVDYNEIYSPVIRYSSLRYLFSLVVHFDLQMNRFMNRISAGDIKLNATLKNLGIQQLKSDQCIYSKIENKIVLFFWNNEQQNLRRNLNSKI